MILRHTINRLADFRVSGFSEDMARRAQFNVALFEKRRVVFSSPDPLGDRSVSLLYPGDKQKDLSVRHMIWAHGGEVFDR